MSSSSRSEHWFDPRLTVFIIWGIFVILFICIPSKRFVQRVCYLMGCTCCGWDEEEIVPSNNPNEREVSYEIMSNARKQEIDSLRASHLTYRLHPFSQTLEKKHMLRRTSDTIMEDEPTKSSSSQGDNTTTQPQDRKPDPQSSHSSIDVETGFVRGMDPPECERGQESKEEEKDEDDVTYTHISIPEAGHNFDGVDVHNDPPTSTDQEEKNKPKEEKKPRKRLFGNNKSKGCQSKDAKEVLTSAGDEGTKYGEEKNIRRRSCPIFCAICLCEFEPSERVSWSSNQECSHIFHEDCIVQWLVSLGRTKSKMHRFTDDPSEAQLLNYQLECPCCRQEFVSRELAELPEVCGEEHV